MKNFTFLKKLCASIGFLFVLCTSIQAQVPCEWRLTTPTFNATDPDGAGPATGSATFTLQIRATGDIIKDVNVLTTGWSYQSANAMIPLGNCTIISNPQNVTVSPAFVAAGFAYTVVNQCGNFNQTAGGQTFNKRVVGTLDGNRIDIGNTWMDVFTVTLWTLGNTAPHGGYVVINSGSSGDNVPPGIVFTTYSVSDIPANEYGVNSLTYTTPLPLVTGALPVIFSKFSANCVSNGTLLEWTTSSEINNSHFNVQRSNNGISFETFAIVQPSQANSTEKRYTYLAPASGDMAYRIEQVDKNGKKTYSDIKRANCTERIQIVRLYPIPAKTELTASFDATFNTTINLSIIDIYGRVVKTIKNVQVTPGLNQIKLATNNLPSGDYILRSSSTSVLINQKFVIVK